MIIRPRPIHTFNILPTLLVYCFEVWCQVVDVIYDLRMILEHSNEMTMTLIATKGIVTVNIRVFFLYRLVAI